MFEIVFRIGMMPQIDLFAGERSAEVAISEEGSRSLSDPRRQYEVRVAVVMMGIHTQFSLHSRTGRERMEQRS